VSALGRWLNKIDHYGKAVTAASGFSLVLLPFIIVFLLVQRRLDENDPKLALAPVHSQPDMPFGDPSVRNDR